MAKEKLSEYEQKTKEFIFVYEVAGIVCLLFSLISIARLGIVGKYGMLTFRLFFVGWYFIFLLLLGALGVYFLFVHHRFTIKNIRYLGTVMIALAIITLSHFAMHNFVSKYEGNSFKNTILLYFDYFKNGRNDMMIGGGLVGCILFYLLFLLFSKVGTIIFCIVVIFVGIVFVCKKTVFEFFKMVKIGLKKCFGGAFKYSKKVGSKLKQFNDDYIVKDKVTKPLPLRKLNNEVVDTSKENKLMLEYIMNIKKELSHLSIFYQDISYIICNHISVIFIKTYQQVNYEVLRISLCKILNEPFLIRYDKKNDMIVIEVNNLIGNSLRMKEALIHSSTENLEIVIGKDDRNDYVICDENLLIISQNDSVYRNYLTSLIFYPKFQKTINEYEIYLLDLNNNLYQFENLGIEFGTTLDFLRTIKTKMDEKLEVLNNNNTNNIDEYNKTSPEKLKKTLVYINGIEKIIDSFEYNQILEYLLITGGNIGYKFIGGCTSGEINLDSLMKSFAYRVFLDNNFNNAFNYVNRRMISSINNKIGGFLKYRDLLIRISLLMLTKEELDKLKR